MLGALAVTAAAACAAGYQTMAPRGQWYGQTFTGLRRGSKKLALTFDDGPNDPYTLRLLDVPANRDVERNGLRLEREIGRGNRAQSRESGSRRRCDSAA